MKKVTTYKTGKNNTHDSLFEHVSYTFGSSPTKEELEEYERDNRGQPETVNDELTALFKWVLAVRDEKANKLGIRDGTEINHKNASDYGPVFSSALSATYGLRLAFDFHSQADHNSAFNALLSSIPALLDLQILEYEDQIIYGQKSEAGAKDRLKDLMKNTFQSWLKNNKEILKDRHTMPALMKIETFRKAKETVTEATLRNWLKEVYPNHLRTGAPKKGQT